VIEERRNITLTHEQLNEIAEMAADKAVEKITGRVYQEIGKTFVNKMIWIIGAILTGAAFYLNSKGIFKV
jgi:hypothetical protein